METPSNPKRRITPISRDSTVPERKGHHTQSKSAACGRTCVSRIEACRSLYKTHRRCNSQKVEIDMGSLESAENRLKSVLADFERQGNRMKNGSYVDKKVSMYSILCAVFPYCSPV